MVIAFCSHESLAQSKGIIGVCILVITIRESGKKKKKETEENISLKCSCPLEEAPACSLKEIKICLVSLQHLCLLASHPLYKLCTCLQTALI